MFGINFGAPDIPDAVKRKFAARKKYPGLPRGHYAMLSGVAVTKEEKDEMVIVATNGVRQLWVVERQTAAGVWYGIYTY